MEVYTRQTQNIFITFIQCWTNVEDVGPTLYKCYTNVLCLLGSLISSISSDIYIFIPWSLHGEHTVLQPFRRIKFIIHIAISVILIFTWVKWSNWGVSAWFAGVDLLLIEHKPDWDHGDTPCRDLVVQVLSQNANRRQRPSPDAQPALGWHLVFWQIESDMFIDLWWDLSGHGTNPLLRGCRVLFIKHCA